ATPGPPRCGVESEMRADDLRAVDEPSAPAPAMTDAPAGSGRLARAVAWSAAIVVAVLAPAAYLRVHENPSVWIAHSDAYGYAWQIRLLGAAPTGDIGSRPGVAGVGAVLHGAHALPFEVGPIVLGLAAAVSLALACGAAVRMAFRIPPW